MADITTGLPALSLTDRLRLQQQAGNVAPVGRSLFIPDPNAVAQSQGPAAQVSINGYDPFATAVRPGIPAGGAISSVPAAARVAANPTLPIVTPTQLAKPAAVANAPASNTLAPSGLDYNKLSVAQFAALKQFDPGTFGAGGVAPAQGGGGVSTRLPTLQATPAAVDNSPGQVWDPYGGTAFRPGIDTLPTVMSGQGLLTADPATHATTQLSNVLTRQELANSYLQNGGKVDPATLSLADQNGASKELLAAITGTGNANTAAAAHVAGAEIGAGATLGAAGIGLQGVREQVGERKFETLATPIDIGSSTQNNENTGLPMFRQDFKGTRNGDGSITPIAIPKPGSFSNTAAPKEGDTGTYKGTKTVYKNGKWVAEK